jgi:peptide/nickel transport system permease protein
VNLQALIVRRLLVLPLMLLGIALFSFVLTHAIPADPVAANLGDRAASDPEIVATFQHKWGLDRPVYEQYFIYVWNLAHGNLGTSISTHQPVSLDLRQRLPATIELAVSAGILSVLIGLPLGILSAIRRDRAVDQLSRVGSLIGVSVPVFWLGLVAIVVFYSKLGWAPAPGRLNPTIQPPPFHTGFLVIDGLMAGRPEVAIDTLRHLVLPAIVLSSYSIGIITRMMRSSMLDVLGEDYVRTARAKGLRNRVVMVRHAARNALIPVITVIGLNFGALLSGAVVIETVFAWPGIGLYAFKSATALDFPAIMGVGIVVATVYVLVNMVVDITYALVDPRIRVAG